MHPGWKNRWEGGGGNGSSGKRAVAGADVETADHRLYCRYRKPETQARFGPTLAICINVETLNRIRCAVKLGHQLTVA